MPVIIPNLVFDVWRAVYNPATGVTAAETLYLKDVLGHVHWDSELDYGTHTTGALTTDFTFYIGLESDVRAYDIIKNIRLRDGITLWLPQSANEYWRVTYVEYSPQPFLPHKDMHITRVTGGGPAI